MQSAEVLPCVGLALAFIGRIDSREMKLKEWYYRLGEQMMLRGELALLWNNMKSGIDIVWMMVV